jgi:enoyl-CoA hydratase/carnithine racemase
MGQVLLGYEGAVAVLTISNSPSNCITTTMFRQIGEHMDSIEANPDVRCAVIRGDGRALYTVGADIHEMEVHCQFADREAATRAWLSGIHSVMARLERAKVPLICAMKGISFGAGLELAAASDIRVAAEGGRFAMPDVKLGIIPGYGGTQRLSRLIGTGHALAMVVGALEINVETAHLWGLVDVVTPKGEADTAALVLAQKIAGYGPVALQNARRAIRQGAQCDLSTGLAYEQDLFVQCAVSRDFDEGRRAFIEKRSPVFSGS